MQMKLIGAKLFQKYKQYPYLYWSAMAGYLQGVLNQPEMKKMNLTLARRYIEKGKTGNDIIKLLMDHEMLIRISFRAG